MSEEMQERTPLCVRYFPCDTADKAAQISHSCYLLSHPARLGLNDFTRYHWRVILHSDPTNKTALLELDLDNQIIFHKGADLEVPLKALLGEPSPEDLVKYESFLADAQLEDVGIFVYVSDLIPTPALPYLLTSEQAIAAGYQVDD